MKYVNQKLFIMKRVVALIGLISVVSLVLVFTASAEGKTSGSRNDTIDVLYSPELSGLLDKWVIEYSSAHPGKFINTRCIDDPHGLSLTDNDVIGIVTEEYLHSAGRKSLWSMVVARDVIVPVISAGNPFLEEISETGISPGKFAGVYTEEGKLTWGKVLGSDADAEVNCYCVGDKSLKFCLAQFLQSENLTGNVAQVSDSDELLGSIKGDPYAIGFCRLSAVIDYSNNSIKEGLELVPVDINANGILEHNENIYSCLNDFNRGVWIGKYPGALCRNIHTISAKSPIAPEEKDFLQWILSGGQAYISEAGFSELVPGERQPKIQALISERVSAGADEGEGINTARIFLLLAAIFAGGLFIYVVIRLLNAGRNVKRIAPENRPKGFADNTLETPEGLYFDKTHTWAFMEKSGSVRIGIGDFLQHVTGDLTKVKMKASGESVKRGDVIISLVQDGKQLDIYSPLSGEIVEVNKSIIKNSSLINLDPYSEGWLYTVKPNNWIKDTRKYFMADSYREWIKTEFTRLKDFISSLSKEADEVSYVQVVLQDGGELKDKLLSDYGPTVWEEFQRGFIDTSKGSM